MKLARVVFAYEVPNPSAPSMSRVNWCAHFVGPLLEITRDGDSVRITDTELDRTFIYPWSAVAAAEPLPAPAQVQPLVEKKKARS